VSRRLSTLANYLNPVRSLLEGGAMSFTEGLANIVSERGNGHAVSVLGCRSFVERLQIRQLKLCRVVGVE
jgi:hypothetical protein